MTQCECPAAGYCKRHQTEKTSSWHRLCKLKPKYFQAWEDGRGPGQCKPEVSAKGLAARVTVDRFRRLQGWLLLAAKLSRQGLGDTLQQAIDGAGCREISDLLVRYKRRHACCGKEPISHLNKKWPG